MFFVLMSVFWGNKAYRASEHQRTAATNELLRTPPPAEHASITCLELPLRERQRVAASRHTGVILSSAAFPTNTDGCVRPHDPSSTYLFAERTGHQVQASTPARPQIPRRRQKGRVAWRGKFGPADSRTRGRSDQKENS